MILLLALGCAGLADPTVVAPPGSPPWAVATAAASRELRLYDQLTTLILARGTLVTPAWNDARARLLGAPRAPTPEAWQVWLAADGVDPLTVGVTPDAEAAWRATATVDGRPCAGLGVESREPTAADRLDLPHLSAWDRLFDLRFSADCGRAGTFVLALVSLRGRGSLAWEGASLDRSGE